MHLLCCYFKKSSSPDCLFPLQTHSLPFSTLLDILSVRSAWIVSVEPLASWMVLEFRQWSSLAGLKGKRVRFWFHLLWSDRWLPSSVAMAIRQCTLCIHCTLCTALIIIGQQFATLPDLSYLMGVTPLLLLGLYPFTWCLPVPYSYLWKHSPYYILLNETILRF